MEERPEAAVWTNRIVAGEFHNFNRIQRESAQAGKREITF
jgi:hypothetical protein